VSDYRVCFQIFPQNEGFFLAYAPEGAAFISRVHASDPGPRSVKFDSLEELESRLGQVRLPKQIAHGDTAVYPVSGEQLKSLGFTELPRCPA